MASRRPFLAHGTRPRSSEPTPLSEAGTVAVAGFDGEIIAKIARRHDSGHPTDPDLRMCVVAVDGDVDLDTAPILEQALVVAISHHRLTCLDLRHTDFFGAAGVHVLLAADQQATRLGRAVVLRGMHGMVQDVLITFGLNELFPTID